MKFKRSIYTRGIPSKNEHSQLDVMELMDARTKLYLIGIAYFVQVYLSNLFIYIFLMYVLTEILRIYLTHQIIYKSKQLKDSLSVEIERSNRIFF